MLNFPRFNQSLSLPDMWARHPMPTHPWRWPGVLWMTLLLTNGAPTPTTFGWLLPLEESPWGSTVTEQVEWHYTVSCPCKTYSQQLCCDTGSDLLDVFQSNTHGIYNEQHHSMYIYIYVCTTHATLKERGCLQYHALDAAGPALTQSSLRISSPCIYILNPWWQCQIAPCFCVVVLCVCAYTSLLLWLVASIVISCWLVQIVYCAGLVLYMGGALVHTLPISTIYDLRSRSRSLLSG